MQIELGKMQELTVVKKVDFGVYLAPEDNREDKVLLPGKQVPEAAGWGIGLPYLYTGIPGTA